MFPPEMQLLSSEIPRLAGRSLHGPSADLASAAKGGFRLTKSGIAIIDIVGPLAKWDDSGAAVLAIVEQLRSAVRDEHCRAILIYVDSPGGSIAGIAQLSDEVATAAKSKPVEVYIDDIGTSAAYFAVSQAKRITAGQTAIVGALGVRAVYTDSSAQEKTAGRTVHVISTGEYKAVAPGAAITDRQKEHFQGQINALGDILFQKVSAGRRLTGPRLANVTDGKVFIGQAAVVAGLVDEIGTFDDALAALLTRIPTPKSASHAQLKEAIPNASADFILQQIEAGATLNDAKAAYALARSGKGRFAS